MDISIQTGVLRTHRGQVFYSDRDTFTRFMNKVQPDNNGCWLWTGAKAREYGHFGVMTPFGSKMLRCNIYMHAVINRQVAEVVRHTCDNPICVNPSHLISGTCKDNSQDAVARGRTARGAKVVNKNHNALSEDTVRDIFKLKESGMTQANIARQLNTSPAQVSRVLRREIWSWVVLS